MAPNSITEIAKPSRMYQVRRGGAGIVEVAEGHGVRRAALLAGGDDLAIAERRPAHPGIVLRPTNPLHAEGAFLHDALGAHRDVRIELPVERLGPGERLGARLLLVEPVEVADLVGAVVGAVGGGPPPGGA